MKRYTITGVSKTNEIDVKVVVNGGIHFDLPSNRVSRSLNPGDKLGVMYDKEIDSVPLVYVYKNRISLDNVLNAHQESGLKDFVGNIRWYDRPLFYVAAIKRVAENNHRPDLRAWVNVRTMLSPGFSR